MKQGENGWEGLKSYFYMYVGCTRSLIVQSAETGKPLAGAARLDFFKYRRPRFGPAALMVETAINDSLPAVA
jgi:hypothetical protein